MRRNSEPVIGSGAFNQTVAVRMRKTATCRERGRVDREQASTERESGYQPSSDGLLLGAARQDGPLPTNVRLRSAKRECITTEEWSATTSAGRFTGATTRQNRSPHGSVAVVKESPEQPVSTRTGTLTDCRRALNRRGQCGLLHGGNSVRLSSQPTLPETLHKQRQTFVADQIR